MGHKCLFKPIETKILSIYPGLSFHGKAHSLSITASNSQPLHLAKPQSMCVLSTCWPGSGCMLSHLICVSMLKMLMSIVHVGKGLGVWLSG